LKSEAENVYRYVLSILPLPDRTDSFEDYYADGTETSEMEQEVYKAFLENTSLQAPWIAKKIGKCFSNSFLPFFL
jgi:hypothetical protein